MQPLLILPGILVPSILRIKISVPSVVGGYSLCGPPFLFLSSVLCTLSFVLCPLSFVFCPLSSLRCPLSSVLCPLSSVLCPLSFVLCPRSSPSPSGSSCSSGSSCCSRSTFASRCLTVYSLSGIRPSDICQSSLLSAAFASLGFGPLLTPRRLLVQRSVLSFLRGVCSSRVHPPMFLFPCDTFV